MENKRALAGGAQPPAKRATLGVAEDELAEEEFQEAEEVDELPEDLDEQLAEADVEVELGAAGRNWERPPVPEVDPRRDSLGELLKTRASACFSAFPPNDLGSHCTDDGCPNHGLHLILIPRAR